MSLGGAAGRDTALQAARSRVRFPMVSLEFFIDLSHGTNSAIDRNGYQDCFLGVKAAGASG